MLQYPQHTKTPLPSERRAFKYAGYGIAVERRMKRWQGFCSILLGSCTIFRTTDWETTQQNATEPQNPILNRVPANAIERNDYDP